MIDCDLYRFLEGEKEAVNAYFGEYMSQYAWAPGMEAQLTLMKSKKIQDKRTGKAAHSSAQ